jgi:hypothetical protein
VSTYRDAREPLGVGGIIGDSFSIYFERFGLMFVLSLIPAIITVIVALVIAGLKIGASSAPAEVNVAAGLTIFLAVLGVVLASILSNALIVVAAFDTKIGRSVRIGVYVQRALAGIIPIIMLFIAIVLIAAGPVALAALIGWVLADTGKAIAAILLIATFPWLIYVFVATSLYVPAIVVEGAGFRALGRSWRLTAGYCWRVIGTLLVLYILVAVVQGVGGLVSSLAAAIEPTWLPSLASIAIDAIGGGITAVGTAMIYARLRGIKEGLDVESLADVFS